MAARTEQVTRGQRDDKSEHTYLASVGWAKRSVPTVTRAVFLRATFSDGARDPRGHGAFRAYAHPTELILSFQISNRPYNNWASRAVVWWLKLQELFFLFWD